MAFHEINWYCDTDYMKDVWEKCGRKQTTLKDPNISEFMQPLLTVFDNALKEKKYKLGIMQIVNDKTTVSGPNWKSVYVWGFDPFHVSINGWKVHSAICDVTKPIDIVGPHLAVYTNLKFEALKLGYDKYWGKSQVQRKVVTTQEVFGGNVRTDNIDVM
jgi:hypothetical protein